MNYLVSPQYTYYIPVDFQSNGNGNSNNNGNVNGNNNGNGNGNNDGNVNGNNNGNNGNGNVNGNNNGNANGNNGNGNVNNNNGNGNVNNNNNGNNNGNGNVNGNDGNENANSVFRPQSSSLSIVDQFYYSTYQWGTDDEKMEEALKSINSNNIMDVMKTWNLVHSTEKGESFMEAFFWDADHSQKKEYGQKMATALRDRALAAGVFEDCREDFAVIDQELNSWLYISNDITKNFDNIIKKLAEAENSSNGTPYPQSDQTKNPGASFRGIA